MTTITDIGGFGLLRRRITNQVGVDRIDFGPLTALDVTHLDLATRQTIVTDGGPAPHLYVVESGWLFAHASLNNGGRYIHRIFQAGDLIGPEDMNWSFSTSSVTTATRAIVGRFAKTRYLDLFSNTRRLGAALHAISMADQVILVDTARANTRLEGMDRLSHLLLTIEARQRLTVDAPEDGSFVMPLTQTILADTVGLSPVHTSNALRKLHDAGSIRHEGDRYLILRRQEMIERTGFQDRYFSTHPEWIERLSG